MRIAILVVLMLSLACVTVQAATPTIEKLLPAKNEVTGFGILPDSLTYGKGADVSKIYDGGYELYTKNGVVDAARQMYQHGKDFVEVTVHTMKSAQAATDFVKYWAKERGAKVMASKKGSGFVVRKPNVMAYYAVGKYLITVSAFYAPDRAVKDVNAFVSAIRKKA